MKKIAVLLAFVLVSVAGFAQEYIQHDEVHGFSRSIRTKAYPVIFNNDLYAIAFQYEKGLTEQLYYIMVACTHQPKQWQVKEKDIGAFRMVGGTNVYLEALMPSNCEKTDDGYNIVASYRIPTENVHSMLDLFSLITINKKDLNSERASSIEIPIPYTAADFLMSAYLELLTMTGK